MFNDKRLLNYQEGKPVNLTLRGVVYVPGRMLGGFTFGIEPCDNEFQHVTIVYGKPYVPDNTNDLLAATCKTSETFGTEYNATKALGPNWNQATEMVKNVTNITIFNRDGSELEVAKNVYYIQFDGNKTVTFRGNQHKFMEQPKET